MLSSYVPKFGVAIIRAITDSLYENSLDIYREYVQNASDSIAAAVRSSLITQDEGYVMVSIDPSNARICIEDNGTGIPFDNVVPTLIDIACSDKDGEVAAGQFGIGRLVGAGYCDELIFETSYKGEKEKSIIRIDTSRFRALAGENKDLDAVEIFRKVTSSDFEEEEEDAHYFRVIMNDVNEDELLDAKLVNSYLREVAPIDFSDEFKNLLRNKAKKPLLDKLESLPCVKIYINSYSPLQKKYKCCHESNMDEVVGFEYFELRDEDKDYGWGWVAITNFSTALKKSDEYKCLRLRIHNIQIGNSEVLNKLFAQSRSNQYFAGEIHITNASVRPTTARHALEKGPARNAFERIFREQVAKPLSSVYSKANTYKKSYTKLSETENGTAKPLKDEIDEISMNQKKEIAQAEEQGQALYASVMSVARDNIEKTYAFSQTGDKKSDQGKVNKNTISKVPGGKRGEVKRERIKKRENEANGVLPAGWEHLQGQYPLESIILVAKTFHSIINDATFIISGGVVLTEEKLKEIVIDKLTKK